MDAVTSVVKWFCPKCAAENDTVAEKCKACASPKSAGDTSGDEAGTCAGCGHTHKKGTYCRVCGQDDFLQL